jgi:hypothetical protein
MRCLPPAADMANEFFLSLLMMARAVGASRRRPESMSGRCARGVIGRGVVPGSMPTAAASPSTSTLTGSAPVYRHQPVKSATARKAYGNS